MRALKFGLGVAFGAMLASALGACSTLLGVTDIVGAANEGGVDAADGSDVDATTDDANGPTGDSADASGELSDSADADADADNTSSCRAYAQARCLKDHECYGYPTQWCDFLSDLCPEYLFLPGSTRTPQNVMQCTSALAAMSCDDFIAQVHLPCQTPGLFGPGAACESNVQCVTLSCVGGSEYTCGTCASFVTPGTSCDPNDARKICPIGETCDSTSKQCTPLRVTTHAGRGQPCDGGAASTDCQASLSCTSDGSDAGTGICSTLPGPGMPCVLYAGSTIYPVCDPGTAYCEYSNPPPSTAGTCQPFPAVGAPCGGQVIPNTCVNGYCSAMSPNAGTCTAFAATGAPCVTRPDFVSECASGICAPPNDNDAGANVCHQVAGRDEDCSGPLSTCKSGLTCRNGTCQGYDYSACLAPDGGPARDSGTD